MRKTYTGIGCCTSSSLCGFSSGRGSSASPHASLCRLAGSGVSIVPGDGTGVYIGVSSGSERSVLFDL